MVDAKAAPKGNVTGPRAALGNHLVGQGLITVEQWEKVRGLNGRAMIQTLVQDQKVPERDLVTKLASFYHVPFIDLERFPVRAEMAEQVPQKAAMKYKIVPLQEHNGQLLVAMIDPLDLKAVDEIRFTLNRPIKGVFATPSAIQKRLEAIYGSSADDAMAGLSESLEDAEVREDDGSEEQEEDAESLARAASDSPVIKMVNGILAEAIKKGVSDIHIEPTETQLVVRYRIDGKLRPIFKLQKQYSKPVASRIKIISNLDISNTRTPQDGRTKLKVGQKSFDMRVSTLPTYFGEKVVIRILDKGAINLGLEVLGFNKGELDLMQKCAGYPQGMILVTGPTGSGKTTTLYSVLNYLNSEDTNIITVEDPVEFQIKGINQVPINPAAGMTFAAALKSILRQDPNVIMVGEIRDLETAETAMHASQTGHMVLSTLHTNGAAETIGRLVEMGLEPYQISSSLTMVEAQRLLRKICPNCKVPDDSLTPQLRQKYNIPEEIVFYHGKGCDTCGGSGNKGRIGAYEVLFLNDAIKEMISRRATELELRDTGRDQGMMTMFEDGLVKVMRGLVSWGEFIDVLPEPTDLEIDGSYLMKAYLQAYEKRVDVRYSEQNQERENNLILVVDDSATIRNLVRFILTNDGFEVLEAEDGQAALQVLRKQRPDLIMTDREMPKMDGLELIKKLRSSASTADIPIIMLTSRREEDSEVEGLSAGADDYIGKPIEPAKLAARVRKVLKLYKRMQA